MMNRKNFVLIISVFIASLAFAAGPSKDQVITVEVEAEVPYIEGGLLATKEQAQAAAQRKALEEALGVYVSGQTVVEKARLIDDKIFSRTAGYIHNFKVLSEGRKDADFYVMKARVDVKLGDVKKDLDTIGLLLQQTKVGNPRVLIKIDGIVDGKKSEVDTDLVENKLSESFLSNGFRLVDRDQLEQIHLDQDAKLSDLDSATLAKYGRQLDAEVIVTGKAKAINMSEALEEATKGYRKKPGTGFMMKSYKAEVMIKAIKTSTGQMILTDQELTAVPQIDVTEEGAMGKAFEKALTQTLAATKDRPASPVSLLARFPGKLAEALSQGDNVFVVKLSRLKRGFEDVQEFTREMRTVEGITAVQFRSLDADIAQFDLSHKYADSQILASRLTKLPNMKLSVKGVTGQGVEVELAEGSK